MDQPGTPMPDAPVLTDVHTALAAAVQESQDLKTHHPTSVRLGRYGRAAADICSTRGASLGVFLRKCCEGLVKDCGVNLDNLPATADEAAADV